MLTINVTEEQIARGKPYNDSGCPFALAIKAKTGAHLVRVTADKVKADETNYRTSKRAAQFIRDFDRGAIVAPGRFRLTTLTK